MGNANNKRGFTLPKAVWPGRSTNNHANHHNHSTPHQNSTDIDSYNQSENTYTNTNTNEYRLPSLDDGSIETEDDRTDALVQMDITGSHPAHTQVSDSRSQSRIVYDVLNDTKMLNDFVVTPLPFKAAQQNIFVDLCISHYHVDNATIIRIILSFVDPLHDCDCAYFRKMRKHITLRHLSAADPICKGVRSASVSSSGGDAMGVSASSSGGSADSIRVVVVGESCVGKTELVQRFHSACVFEKGKKIPSRLTLGPTQSGGSFDATLEEKVQSPGGTITTETIEGGGTIEDSYEIRFKIKNYWNETCRFALTILDTGGMEDFKSLRNYWLSEAQVAVFVYDVSRFNTFFELNEWYANTLMMACSENRMEVTSFPIVLVANKCDLYSSTQTESFVTSTHGLALADQWGVPFLEVSAWDDVNVERVFHAAVLEYWVKKNGQ